MTGKENIISTIPQDPVYIASWEEVLNRSAILELPVNAKTLVDNVAQIGYENAISKSRYRDSILSYLNEWTRETSESSGTGKVQYANTVWQSLDADQQGITIVINYTSKWVKAISQETTDYLQRNVYNADISRPGRKSCVKADKRQSREGEQIEGQPVLGAGRLDLAYSPVFRDERRYARAA